MEIFPALGLAVAGIFAVIMLSGALAGIIAYGLIDSRYRAEIQSEVLGRIFSRQVGDFFSGFDKDKFDKFRNRAAEGWWGTMTLSILADNYYGGIANWVGLEPHRLFQLPHRQLCAQIVNAVATESYQYDDEREAGFCPLTMLLFIASGRPHSGDYRSILAPYSAMKTRSLAFVDAIQIELIEAIQRRASLISTLVISLALLAIIIPNLEALNIFTLDRSTLLRTVGVVLALIVAPILVITLSLAARIVALLTFKWIDRFASAR